MPRLLTSRSFFLVLLLLLIGGLAASAAVPPVMRAYRARLKVSHRQERVIIRAAEAAAARKLAHPEALIEVPYAEQLPIGEELNSRAGGLVSVVYPGGRPKPVSPHDIAIVTVRAWQSDGEKMLKLAADYRKTGWLVLLFASRKGLPKDAPADFVIDNGGGPGPEDAAMNGIANMVNAWMWCCEYTAALTRHGKYPGVLMSIFLPGSAEFDKKLQNPEGQVQLWDCATSIRAGTLARAYLRRVEQLGDDILSNKTQAELAKAADLIVARLAAGKRVGVSTLSHYMIGEVLTEHKAPWDAFNAAGSAKTAFKQHLGEGDLLLWIGYIGLSSPYEDYGKFIRESKADYIAYLVPDTDAANNAPDALCLIEAHWKIGDAEVAIPFPPGKMAPVSGIDQALVYRLLDEMVAERLANR